MTVRKARSNEPADQPDKPGASVEKRDTSRSAIERMERTALESDEEEKE